MSIARIQFPIIFEEVNNLISLNNKDDKEREKIIKCVKECLQDAKFINTCILELDEVFSDGFQLSDVSKVCDIVLSKINVLAKRPKLKNLRYIVYSLVIMYLNEHFEAGEELRKLFNDSFNLVELNPSKIIPSNCVIC